MKFIERPLLNTAFDNGSVLSNLAQRRPIQALNSFSLSELNPFDLPDMNVAVDILLHAKEQQLVVVCVVDYDADGICSGSVLSEGLSRLGINVGVLIADRHEDGYGFSSGTCDKLLSLEVLPDVIITADLGSSDGIQIKRFQDESLKRGRRIPVIVTDHHHISKLTPPATADAFINPGRSDVFHVFEHPVCGAAVAWLLIDALSRSTPSHLDPHSLLDIVAVATIGDMVSLANPVNRMLVREGLALINQAKRPVWRGLLEALNKNEIREDDIAFQIVPRINALSRMGDDGQNALTWLTSEDQFACMAAYENMDINNDERKDEQSKCQSLALSQAKLQASAGMYVCVCYVPEFTHGVVGLAASHVVKETGLPAIAISVKDNGDLTGSARSIPGFDLRLAIERAQDETGLLTKFGGHAMAAGLSMKSVTDIAPFHAALNSIAAAMLNRAQPEPTFFHDGELPEGVKHIDGVESLRSLAPFGQDFPAPAYLLKGLVTGVKLMGKEFQHAKLTLSNGLNAVWFNHGGAADKVSSQIVELIVTPSINEWNGKKSVQFIAQAVKMEG